MDLLFFVHKLKSYKIILWVGSRGIELIIYYLILCILIPHLLHLVFFIALITYFLATYLYVRSLSYKTICVGLDLRYSCNEKIYTAYHILEKNIIHPFKENIIAQAQQQIEKIYKKEKERIQRKFPLHWYAICLVILIFFVLSEKIDHQPPQTIPPQHQKIIKASSIKIKNIASKIKLLDDSKFTRWKTIAEKWENPQQNDLTLNEIMNDLKILQDDVISIKTQMNTSVTQTELTKTLDEWHSVKNKRELIKKISDKIPQNELLQIQKNLQENLLEEAAKIYLKSQKQQQKTLQDDIINKFDKWMDNIQARLNLSQQNPIVSSKESNQGDAYDLGSQKHTNFFKDTIPVVPENVPQVSQGWEKDYWPHKYKNLVEKYMHEKKEEQHEKE